MTQEITEEINETIEITHNIEITGTIETKEITQEILETT